MTADTPRSVVNSKPRKCVWFTGPGKNCGCATRYKMVPESGKFGAPLVPKYNAFCDSHLIVLAAVKEETIEAKTKKSRGRKAA